MICLLLSKGTDFDSELKQLAVAVNFTLGMKKVKYIIKYKQVLYINCLVVFIINDSPGNNETDVRFGVVKGIRF